MLPTADNPTAPAFALTPKERLFWAALKRALQVAQKSASEFARACTIGITAIDELLKE